MRKKFQDELKEFKIECIVNEVGSVVTKRDLYNHYIDWAEKKGYAIESIKVFGKELKRCAQFIIPKIYGGKHGKRVWLNVSIFKTGARLK